MSNRIINLPFFKIKNGSVFYLEKCKYPPLDGLQLTGALKDKLLIDEGIIIQKRHIDKNKKIKEKILVVEPHPDDFALSASGYTLNALPGGASVTVLNIFSKTSVTKFPWRDKINISNKQYEKLRINESIIAIEKYLGEKFESLRLSSPTLTGDTETYPRGYHQNNLIKDIAKHLENKIIKEKFNTVLCPMAIQGHIAHSITFDAVIDAFKSLKQNFDLIIYEDIPYARNKTAYFKRLKKLKMMMDMKDFSVATDKYLEIMADLAIIYRSQFDDINRQQMLAIIKEDFRATSPIKKSANENIEFSQRYFKVNSLK